MKLQATSLVCKCGHTKTDHKLADQAGRPCKHPDKNCLCPRFRELAAVQANRRWDVTLYQGGFIIEAESEHAARSEALRCLTESLDLFVAQEIEPESVVAS